MTELPEKPLSLKTRRMLPLFIGLIAAGLAGNYFKFPIFLNIDFLFGSIFAMLALQFFGLGRGILAAAIIASYTYFLWNHPYAIIIMTAEVAVVGWLMNRRKMGMVLADTLYWLIIGMPLVYLFYHFVMHVPFSNTSIVMIKQAMNGIANALVARLIFTGFALRSRSSLTSYREIVYNLLAFFVLCPALIMLAVGSRTDFAETDRRIRTTLIQDSQHGNHMSGNLGGEQEIRHCQSGRDGGIEIPAADAILSGTGKEIGCQFSAHRAAGQRSHHHRLLSAGR